MLSTSMSGLKGLVTSFLTQEAVQGCCSCLQGCTLAHILGLYKLTGSTGQAFTLGVSGTTADLILWLIARIQSRIFRTNSHARWVHEPAGPLLLRSSCLWLSFSVLETHLHPIPACDFCFRKTLCRPDFGQIAGANIGANIISQLHYTIGNWHAVS